MSLVEVVAVLLLFLVVYFNLAMREAEIARLNTIIENAPHDRCCVTVVWPASGRPCDCWKKQVFKEEGND